jgi:signal transduction histidine kinase
MRIRGVGYFSPTGEFKYGVEVNSRAATTAPMSEELKRTLQDGVPILANGSSEELVSGLARHSGGIVIVTRSPILDSARAQPSKGSFVFVMSVDQQLIDELSTQTRLNVSLYPSDTKKNTKARIEVISPEYILGRAPVKGLSNENIATIQIMRPRDVHLQGLAARNTLLLCIVLSSVVAILITVAAVNRIILSTLKAAVDQVQEISRTGDMSHRLGGGGTDELGMLATQINSMLDTITRTQHELQIARDRAQAADAAKSTFIAKVSHELRTPIHGVVGMRRILMK